MGEIIHLNEEEVKAELGEMVRKTVEDTLNALLDEEANEITQAHRYERTENRLDTRAGVMSIVFRTFRRLIRSAEPVEPFGAPNWVSVDTRIVATAAGGTTLTARLCGGYTEQSDGCYYFSEPSIARR